MVKKRTLTELEKQECAELKRIFDDKKRSLELTQEKAAEILGISQSGLGGYLLGRNALNLQFAIKISNLLKCQIEDFSTRLANSIPNIAENRATYSTHNTETTTHTFKNQAPVISWVQAGDFCEAIDNFQPGDADEWLPMPLNAGTRTFALRVVGDSMTNPNTGGRNYPEGCYIFVDPDKETLPGHRTVAKLPENNSVTFKELVEDSGIQYLRPLNPQYDKIQITEETHFCGRVIGSYTPE